MKTFQDFSHAHHRTEKGDHLSLQTYPLLFIYLFLNERLFHLIRPLFIVWDHLKPFEKFALKLSFRP